MSLGKKVHMATGEKNVDPLRRWRHRQMAILPLQESAPLRHLLDGGTRKENFARFIKLAYSAAELSASVSCSPPQILH